MHFRRLLAVLLLSVIATTAIAAPAGDRARSVPKRPSPIARLIKLIQDLDDIVISPPHP
jgi:hypothetical protein